MTNRGFIMMAGLIFAIAAAGPAQEPQPFVDHGIAAPVSESRGAIATADGEGHPLILAVALDIYEGTSRASLLVINAATGETGQYWYPEQEAGNGANYGLMVSSKGRFYFMPGSVFLEFDLGKREWSFARDLNLGTAMGLCEGPDGTVYAGTYPESQLLAFDPATRELVHLGQLDPSEKYPFTLAADEKGWVYAGIGTARANLVAFNAATKERRQLVDDAERKTGTGQVHLGQDGKVYGRLPGQKWLRLYDGHAEPVEEASPAKALPNISWGRMFCTFPDGSTLAAFDMPGKTFSIADGQGVRKDFAFAYDSAGAGITTVAAGPGGKVYGSTCHPFRLFACTPASGKVENLGGLNKVGGGNFCGMAALDGLLYGAAYCGGWLYAYDPAQPWHESDDDSANPRIVCQYDPEITRPRMALALPEAHTVVYAGFPGYGRVGGSVAFYDAAEGKAGLLANEDVLPGHSTITMRALADGTLIAGTSIDAPGGAQAVAPAGRLYMFEPTTRKVLFDTEPVAGAREVSCLETGDKGTVYGITNTSRLFTFDPAARTVTGIHDLSEYGNPLRPDQSLLRAPDGRVFCLMSKALLEIDGKTGSAGLAATLPVTATAGSAIADGRVYFAAGSHLCSIPLPGGG